MASRYAAHEKSRFFLRQQYDRVAQGAPYAKSRIMYSAWKAGAPVGGLPLPLVAPRLRSPLQLIDSLMGPARRSIAARFFMGNLDIAAYSGNWDLSRGYIPSRACAYCYQRWRHMTFVKDEWHIFLVCPLYDGLRPSLPFSAESTRVGGHRLQGDGCTPCNLRSLVRSIMFVPRFEVVADFLLQAQKKRRQFRQSLSVGMN